MTAIRLLSIAEKNISRSETKSEVDPDWVEKKAEVMKMQLHKNQDKLIRKLLVDHSVWKSPKESHLKFAPNIMFLF